VKVLVRRSDLVPPYDDSAEVDGLGDTIRATCLGQPRWLKDSNTLELRPVYVYLS
jgi:hypothetical protein